MKIDIRHYRKVYFGTDFHWHHDREFIWGNRGFADVWSHDAALEQELREKLTDEDLFVYQGDWSLNSQQEDAERLLKSIPCPIIYIMGNHDQRISRFIQKERTTGAGLFGVQIKNEEIDIRFYTGVLEICWVRNDGSKQACSHSHYPQKEWNHMNHGAWSLSGHVHGNLESGLPTNLDNKCLDLSYDSVGQFLLTFEEVDAIMRKKKNTHFHHGKKD